MNTHNGYTNYETWLVSALLANTESVYWRAVELAKCENRIGLRAITLELDIEKSITPEGWLAINWEEVEESLKEH